MTDTKPVLYLFYGDDNFAMEDYVRQMQSTRGDSSAAAMNTEQFDARNLDLSQLSAVCAQVPFLADRRLVIVDHAELLSKLEDFEAQLVPLLESLPNSTGLVFLERLSTPKPRKQWQRTKLRDWAEQHPERCFVRLAALKRGERFTEWIMKQAVELEGEIEPDAAQLLGEWVADDPYLADQEIRKLLDYADRQRPVTAADVEELTPFRGQGNIFDFVDALGGRPAQAAQLHLARVLQESDVRYAFAMIVRQFRLLILAREAIDLGTDANQALSLPPFIVQRILSQARAFSSADLDRIYHELMRIDRDVKSSQLELDVALDSLIGALAQP